MAVTPVVRMRAVSKIVGGARLLDGVDLDVAPGSCVGLSGPNGSGRTTLLRIAAALWPPEHGMVEVAGIDAVRFPFDARLQAMLVGAELPCGTGLRAREYVDFVRGARSGRAQPLVAMTTAAALERAGVTEESRVDDLSAGLRKRLVLTAALVVAPPVLLLDDPFASLDTPARARYRDWIAEWRDAGVTVVAALNDAAETSALCDVVIEMERGRIVSQSSSLIRTSSSPIVPFTRRR